MQSPPWDVLFAQAPAPITVTEGPEHVVKFMNAPARRLLSAFGDIDGKPILAAIPQLRDGAAITIADQVFRSGERFVGTEVPILLDWENTGTPSERFFHIVYEPLRDPAGGVLGIMTLGFDVTDQVVAKRRAEALAEALRHSEQALKDANRRKDEFLALLGHELRNPLAPIVTALQLMRLRGEGSERERAVIERQVRHMVQLVDDLLDISRITRGKIKLKTEPVELASVIAKAVEMASPLLEQRAHQLELAVARRGLQVMADPMRLAQVFANLLTNSAKYTEPLGAISIRAARDGGRVRVSVRDNGMGIAPELLPRIFEPFLQAPRALDRSQGGLGIGLALVKSLVELHGGRVQAHSEGAGKGSEFVVELPMLAAAEVQPREERSITPLPGERRLGRRVLVVDDNPDAAEMLGEGLRMLGYEVAIAHDGPQALEAVGRFTADAAVLDIGLPVMDGYELARRLRKQCGSSLRLLAVTGYGQSVDRARSKRAGFDEHFVKPVGIEALDRALAK